MNNHRLDLSTPEARALVNAAFLGLKGSRAIKCATDTRQSLSGKLATLLAEVLEAKSEPKPEPAQENASAAA